MTDLLQPDVILDHISFRQVIASEDGLSISVLALSTLNELYYVHGTRASTAVLPQFTASAVPIRRNVGLISTQYNHAANASEVVYVDTSNELKHLWRDTATGLWSEQVIHVPAPSGIMRQVSFCRSHAPLIVWQFSRVCQSNQS